MKLRQGAEKLNLYYYKYIMADEQKYDEVYMLFLATLAVVRETLIVHGSDKDKLYFGLIAEVYDDIVDVLNRNTDETLEIFTPPQKWLLRNCVSDFKAHVRYIERQVLSHAPITNFKCRAYYLESLTAIERRRNPVI